MKIAYLGTGTWGFCLASLLAANGHKVTSWSLDAQLVKNLNNNQEHPFLPGFRRLSNMHFTTSLEEALDKTELIVESVTSAGLRPVLTSVKKLLTPNCPIVITSKGIEQNTGEVLPEVAVEVFGEKIRPLIGMISGPSFAAEVIQGLPTSVVGTAYNFEDMMLICDTFTNHYFRVYPNADVSGVAFGGALKNIIAIACGISDGLAFGNSSKAALITRGLHEIRKLAAAKGCKPETLNGLSGLGDLCLTCSSTMSRNYRFGLLLAEGVSPTESKDQIKMVVEGAYTCVSALQLSKQLQIPMPITEMVYKIIYENMNPKTAATALMQRTIKEEHL
ncbi:Glycerol-3-phosphate dehydrogenase [NAD(P)+] [Chlamydiales bacterium STE3]|nr:Glycerol-3-phosphate dehydrogenase [NAD(P)+] [Chlamydiales bacterium STE3]